MVSLTTKKQLTIAIASVFVFSMFIIPLSIGDLFPIMNPVILALGNDQTIRDTTKKLANNIEGAIVIPVVSPWQLLKIEGKVTKEVFYVAHGCEDGLSIGSHIIGWAFINQLVDNSLGSVHYFAACDSNNIDTEKPVLTFAGPVDADIAAYTILTYYSWFKGEYETSLNYMKQAFIQTFEKIVNPDRVRYLRMVKYKQIWFDTLDTPVRYEHPNRATYGITTYYTSKNIEGDDFAASHLRADYITYWALTGNGMSIFALVAGAITLILAAIPEFAITKLMAAVAGLIWVLLGIAGQILRIWVSTYVPDEWGGCGWCFTKDAVYVPLDATHGWLYYRQKWGWWMWTHVSQYFAHGVAPGPPIVLPEWYGGLLIDRTPL